jgi:limonene-1,2-epoxide hydrolase
VLTERVDIIRGPGLYIDHLICANSEVKDGQITLWREYFDYASLTGKLLLSPFRALLRRGR